jgi:hypothetical protein
MSAHVVLVQSDPLFLRACETALRSDVEVFNESMSALNRQEQADHIDVLITRTPFSAGPAERGRARQHGESEEAGDQNWRTMQRA